MCDLRSDPATRGLKYFKYFHLKFLIVWTFVTFNSSQVFELLPVPQVVSFEFEFELYLK